MKLHANVCSRLAAISWLALVGACEPAPEFVCADELSSPLALSTPVALVDAEAWHPSPAQRDPLPEHRPSELWCPADSWGEEFGVFEVSTADCNYLSVEQPLADALHAGDSLRLSLWWAALIAAEPALAHLALFVDGELLWEREVEIPGSAAALELEFPSPLSAPAGAPVTFHLHNHGQNSWTLAGLERVETYAPPCED